jgi:hypothetical protein
MSYKFLRGNLSGAAGNSDIYVTELSASEKLTLGSAYSFTSAGALTAGAIAGSTVSGSGNVSVGGQLTINDYSITRAGVATLGATSVSTLGASGLASLDGGINVDDNFTVSAAGAVVAVGVNAGGAITGATTVSGSSNFLVGGQLTLNDYSFTRAGVLTIASMGGDWTNASRTVADMGTVTTIDINGGSIDGTAIGAAAQSTLKATTISGSGAATLGGTLGVDGQADFGGAVNIDGALEVDALANLDGGIEIDASGNKFTVSTAGIVSGAGDFRVGDALELGPAGEYGIQRDGQADIASMGTNWTNAGRTVADGGIFTTLDLNGGTIDGTAIGSAAQSTGKFTTVSGSSNFSVGGYLELQQGTGVNGGSAHYLFIGNSAEAGLALYFRNNSSQMQGVISMGGGAAANLRLEGDAAKEVAAVLGDTDGNAKWRIKDSAEAVLWQVESNGALSGSKALKVSTLQASNTVAATPTLSSDSLVWIDDGVLKSRSFSAYADSIAGSGVTATNGVLSVDTTGGDSISVTNHGDSNQALSGGLNFSSGGISTSRTWTLPASPDVGDVIYVKGGANLSSARKITIARAGSQVIDDSLTSIELVSPNASVGLIFTSASAGTLGWKIV